jgi:hypothetical protein
VHGMNPAKFFLGFLGLSVPVSGHLEIIVLSLHITHSNLVGRLKQRLSILPCFLFVVKSPAADATDAPQP